MVSKYISLPTVYTLSCSYDTVGLYRSGGTQTQTKAKAIFRLGNKAIQTVNKTANKPTLRQTDSTKM